MRYNKSALATLASNPNTTFDKEGLLTFTERPDSIFGRSDVNYTRWCKLRGNLLFYLKDHDPQSAPLGLLVLENCQALIKKEEREYDGFAFVLEFEGSAPQRFVTSTPEDRLDWLKCLQLAPYAYLNQQIAYLKEQTSEMGNRIETGIVEPTSSMTGAANMQGALVLNPAALINRTEQSSTSTSTAHVEEDLSEVPICESALSCDIMRCETNAGNRLSTRIVCAVRATMPGSHYLWRDFARTEVVEHTCNPQYTCTFRFHQSAGFTADSRLRFTLYDVREKVTGTAVPIGYAEVELGVIQDATRFRVPLRSVAGDCGFITIATWAPETDRQTPPRSTTQVFEQQSKGHRRSQSLPPKLGVKLFVPFQGSVQRVFANPVSHTYRLHSGIGGDISVHETLLESKLCFALPQQLLTIWILREKELLQEISGMGELGGDWRRRQMELLDKHLKLLNDYSHAKQNLLQISKEEGSFFKRSSVKTDESLEFIPVNLHLQRMWAHNDTLNRTGVLDIVTVGAFTRHASKSKRTGGLIKLLQETKESPSKFESGNACKVQAANDVVQVIKQLRKEIVEIMSQLLSLARSRNSKGMMPLCEAMISKTKTLLYIWEPNLVKEAFAFIEQHRIIEEPDNVMMPMSPFRKITQQLGALDLKSPELEDFATPVVAPPDLWPRSKQSTGSGRALVRSNSFHQWSTQTSNKEDAKALSALRCTVKCYNAQLSNGCADEAEASFQSLPLSVNSDLHMQESYFAGEQRQSINHIDVDAIEVEVPSQHYASYLNGNCAEAISIPRTQSLAAAGGFLDTRIMSTSPSANYYRPTEEPEPLDLTQLNIEASVMCLVSKIKFLCGRCGTPPIRLRHPKTSMKRAGFSNSPAPDVVAYQLANQNDNESGERSTVNGNNLNLDLTQPASTLVADDGDVQLRVKKGNKFTDGLDLSLTTDWVSELRPSMRKLRHAMDGLLKTARLMHSVQRLQQDMQRNSINLEIMYRRDVCFSQAFTALVSALMAKLWGSEITENFIRILDDLGPLLYFEGLLSLYGGEIDMWGDMCIAIEDLLGVNFTLVRSQLSNAELTVPMPRITGSRQSLHVYLPVPEHVYVLMPTKHALTFKVTPVFFNIGINEKATIAETLGQTREQNRSNWDNYLRLKQYYSRFRKLPLSTPDTPSKHEPHLPASDMLIQILGQMEQQLRAPIAKNVGILQMAEEACRSMSGLRFTSCKSAKDRTGMSVTLEQCHVLLQEFQLAAKSVPNVLSTMRSEGTRMDNVYKNIGKRKYAFNLPQVYSLPAMYRPPVGAYGKAET